MSFIRNIEGGYLAAVIAKTRRDDAALIAKYSRYPCGDGDSGQLLWALLAQWPHDQFDELNVAIDAPRSPQLMAALRFMRPKIQRQRGTVWMLSSETERDVLRWILGVAGREVGRLRLDRTPAGWCTVEVAGRRQ